MWVFHLAKGISACSTCLTSEPSPVLLLNPHLTHFFAHAERRVHLSAEGTSISSVEEGCFTLALIGYYSASAIAYQMHTFKWFKCVPSNGSALPSNGSAFCGTYDQSSAPISAELIIAYLEMVLRSAVLTIKALHLSPQNKLQWVFDKALYFNYVC